MICIVVLIFLISFLLISNHVNVDIDSTLVLSVGIVVVNGKPTYETLYR